jgi:hypothetical protein
LIQIKGSCAVNSGDYYESFSSCQNSQYPTFAGSYNLKLRDCENERNASGILPGAGCDD